MSHDLIIHFHGVRGSIAAPGVSTAKVGGNTSCVEVLVGDTRIVFDAGTGLRALGERLIAAGPSATTAALDRAGGNQSAAARALGISRNRLARLLR